MGAARLFYRATEIASTIPDSPPPVLIPVGLPKQDPNLEDKQRGFARVWTAYQERIVTSPDETKALVLRLQSYDSKLDAAGLDDDDLLHPPRLWLSWGPSIFLLHLIAYSLLLPPLFVFGFLANAPSYFLLRFAVPRIGKLRKDEATLKILGGLVLFPLSWIFFAVLAALGEANLHDQFPALPTSPIWAGLVTFVLCALEPQQSWFTRTWSNR